MQPMNRGGTPAKPPTGRKPEKICPVCNGDARRLIEQDTGRGTRRDGGGEPLG